ncbi:MAG TPA: histidine kinase dimerization/phospho-acceptor domain-containing protein, partial [Kofleriaceae bacterium]|nr:histidine kinase dimerization/phospho-acceptor domain-containing protein [Kofleriaceae bacterium]
MPAGVARVGDQVDHDLAQQGGIGLDHHRAGAAADPAATDEARADAQRIESLGLIAGGIAHDFNNLLVGVLAEASAAREDAQLGEGTREALRRIEAAAGRMTQLTRQLLAYTGRGRFVTVR